MSISKSLRHTALLANEETCAQTARRATEEALAVWHLADVRDDALLLVSELVTNAYRHGIPPIFLEVSVLLPGHDTPATIQSDGRARLQFDVRDNSPVMPERRCGGDGGGFGLTVATALAAISYHPQPTGKIVRAVLKLSDADSRKLVSPPKSRELQSIHMIAEQATSLAVRHDSGQRDLGAAEHAAAALLKALGIDINTPSLAKTPGRMIRAYTELLTPRDFDLTVFPNDEGYEQLVIEREIPFRSLCEHHFLPFVGSAYVCYLPGEHILGLSKLARVVELFAHRPQVQERLTQQVADWLHDQLKPKGVGVVLVAEHLCMTLRGARATGSTTVTSALHGLLLNDARAREEFHVLAGIQP